MYLNYFQQQSNIQILIENTTWKPSGRVRFSTTWSTTYSGMKKTKYKDSRIHSISKTYGRIFFFATWTATHSGMKLEGANQTLLKVFFKAAQVSESQNSGFRVVKKDECSQQSRHNVLTCETGQLTMHSYSRRPGFSFRALKMEKGSWKCKHAGGSTYMEQAHVP